MYFALLHEALEGIKLNICPKYLILPILCIIFPFKAEQYKIENFIFDLKQNFNKAISYYTANLFILTEELKIPGITIWWQVSSKEHYIKSLIVLPTA